MKFSIEITPKADVAELPRDVRDVSITFLPGGSYSEVVAQTAQLRQQGFNPMPHVPARSLRSRLELQDFVAQLKDVGVRQVLLIGGSLPTPLGPFASTLDLLDTGLFEGLRLGVAGHPEGMPQLHQRECDRILALKNDYARDTGTDMFIVTQWCLDVPAIAHWLDRIQEVNSLPIYLGIPGPATPTSLLKFASICGVKASLLGLRHQSARLGQLMAVQTPDPLIDALQDRIDYFHIYTFGGIRRTRDWLTARYAERLIQV